MSESRHPDPDVFSPGDHAYVRNDFPIHHYHRAKIKRRILHEGADGFFVECPGSRVSTCRTTSIVTADQLVFLTNETIHGAPSRCVPLIGPVWPEHEEMLSVFPHINYA